MSAQLLNTTKQNINFLATQVTGINNSGDKISDAITSIYLGINQWGVMDKKEIEERLLQGQITLDSYVAFKYQGGTIVDTARRILEIYNN